MTIPTEILSPVVEQIRTWRRGGLSMSEILHHLWPARDRLNILGHLRIAFCCERLKNFELFPDDEQGMPLPKAVDQMLGPQVDEAKPRWENAAPYPDLYRRSDRHAFRAVAKAFQARILVAAADQRAAPFAGKPGYRPEVRPNPRETAVIRKQNGQQFYPGYHLQGVYSAETSENLWRGRMADQIRFELNQRMGEDLVPGGPLDIWALRLQAGIAVTPRVPVIVFEPDGNVDVRHDLQSLRAYYKYRYLPWDRLYGSVAVE